MGFKLMPMASRDHIPIVPSPHPHPEDATNGFERGCLITGGWDDLSEYE